MADSEKVINDEMDEYQDEDIEMFDTADDLVNDREGITKGMVRLLLEYVQAMDYEPLLHGHPFTWGDLGRRMDDPDSDMPESFRERYAEIRKQLDERALDAGRKPHARKGEYVRRKSGKNVLSTSLNLLNGPLTNAIMGRTGRDTIDVASYFNEKSNKVNTGSGGYVLVDIRTRPDMDLEQAYRDIQLNDRDRFWLDALYTLAIEEGMTNIQGSEILKKHGYSNPYDASAASSMADACRTCTKAAFTQIAVDVTNEKRNKRKGHAQVSRSIRLQPVVNATIDLDEYEEKDEEGNTVKVMRDFTVNLQTPNPIDSLPLAAYEQDRGMLTTVTAEDYIFSRTGAESVGRLSIDDRQMWLYVLRVIKSRTLSGTILFETMWTNLDIKEPEVSPLKYPSGEKKGVPVTEEEAREEVTPEVMERRRKDAVRKQHARMVKKLEKMLDQKKGVLFSSWSWHKNKGTGLVDGISIRRKRTS